MPVGLLAAVPSPCNTSPCKCPAEQQGASEPWSPERPKAAQRRLVQGGELPQRPRTPDLVAPCRDRGEPPIGAEAPQGASSGVSDRESEQRQPSPSPGWVRSSHSKQFYTELNFVRTLTHIADKMRFTDPTDRQEALAVQLDAMNNLGKLGFFPMGTPGEKLSSVIRIAATEGYVFKTKARAPTLVLFEIIRQPDSRHGAELAAEGGAEALPSPVEHTKEDPVLAKYDSPSPGGRRRRSSSPRPSNRSPTHSTLEVEVEMLIGDQIERRLTQSFDEEAVDSEDFGFIAIDESRGKSELGGPMPYIAQHGQSRFPVPARDEVRDLVKAINTRVKSLGDLNMDDEETGDCSTGGNRSSLVQHWLPSPKSFASQSDSALVSGTGEALNASPPTPPSTAAAVGPEPLEAASGKNQARSKAPADPHQVPEVIRKAMELRQRGDISEEELRKLIEKDKEFRKKVQLSLEEDERFCMSLAFGESWQAKKERIRNASPEGHRSGWDLVGLIIKTNDDLRQEVCALQLIELSRALFQEAGLPLFLRTFRVVSTDASSGLIEVLTDAISLDALKKRQLQQYRGRQPPVAPTAGAAEGFTGRIGSLLRHFEATYGSGTPRFETARWHFASSLAAYSVVCYVFAIKDRHNGNILLDTEGHLIHIDFGFLLGIAPGGAFSIETAPFKLTEEMIQVLGDVQSKLFGEFVLLFTCGFLALQSAIGKLTSIVEVMCDQSPFPCFFGKDKAEVLQKLQSRLRPDLDKKESVAFAIDLIRQSMGSALTRQYDNYQWLTNGILP